MPRFVALLRGVNVGKGPRVPMAAFKALLQGLGCTEVATLLNSGNAVFSSPQRSASAHAQRIAGALAAELGVSVSTIVKTGAELAAAAAGNPIAMAEADPSRVLLAFAADRAALDALAPLQALVQPPEQFAIGAHAAYLHCPDGILQSTAAAALLGKAGRAITTRNWATTLKLLALCGSDRP